MRFTAAVAALCAATLVDAAKKPLFPDPFTFPLKNGFPDDGAAGIAKTGDHASGGIPVGAQFPTKMTATAIETFQLIALNEIFEVAFFTELLKNVTHEVPGYKVKDKKYVMRALRRIRAQEELHFIGANALIEGVKATPIKPCKYRFPVSDYVSAIALANLFTDVVLAVVPAATVVFAEDGGQEPGLLPLVGSILAQEGEQNGWFRAVQGKDPSAAPFLTGTAPQFAASAIKLFIVPGSCPFVPDIVDKAFPPLYITNTPEAKTMALDFWVQGTGISASKMSIAYMNGQSVPYVEKITDVVEKDGMTTFKAIFPYKPGFAGGLTVAALVKGTGKLASSADVAAATLYGPGLIEVD